MKNYFLLIFFLWTGILNAQSPALFTQQKIGSIDIPSHAMRTLIETKDFTTQLNFCDLVPHQPYIINIIPANQHDCYPSLFIDRHRIAENQSHRLEFTAAATCEVVDLSNTCGPMASTYYYVSIMNNSIQPEAPAFGRSMGIMTSTGAPESLVRDVFLKGDCVVVENITYQGNSNAIGRFSGGGFVIGIEEGLIITSGAVNLAQGPNSQTGSTAPWGDTRGDGDLEGTAGDDILDAAVLEFDFTPTGDMVSFDFVFGSEEYCDYVNAPFNDAFGFYLTGPGHNGTNIARVNGTGPSVSINTINHLQNSQYYVDNVPPNQQQAQPCVGHIAGGSPFNALIAYDGFTVKLTAIASVEPCVPYHIKLAVGDAVDDFFDSAVLLGANSFNAASLVTIDGVIESGDPFAVEGCDGAFLVFTRENFPIEQPVVLNYQVSNTSTATPGQDYEALSGSVTINAGSYQTQIPINITPDNLPEGTETIVIELRTSLCGDLCEDVQTVTIEIQDGTPLAVDFAPVPTCGESSTTLSPTIGGGSGDYSYEWSDGSSAPTLNVNLTNTPTTYTVTVTDNDGCAAGVATIEVSGGEAPEASIEGEASICQEPANEIFLVSFTGNGPWTLEYSIDGSSQPAITGITDNPYELLATEVGTYSLESVSANNCPGLVFGTASIELSELLLFTNKNDLSCGGANDGTASVTIDGGTGPYTIEWSNGASGANISGLMANQYTVTVTDVNDCSSESSVEIEEPTPLEAAASVTSAPDCDNPNGGNASLSVNGGSSPYSFSWNNGTTNQNLQGVAGGTYEVLVTDDSGCTITAGVNIPNGGEIPEAVATSPNDINCNNPEISLSGVGSSTGTYLWTTDDGNIVNGASTLTPTIDETGTYTLTVTNAAGCMASAEVTVLGDASVPLADAGFPEDLTCLNNGMVTLDGSASSSGNEFSYIWTTQDGNIVNGANSLSPTVDAPGTYILTVTNTVNNCEETASVIIGDEMLLPTIQIDTPESFDCTTATSSIVIDASGSSNGNEFDYEWTTNNGTIEQGANTLTPSVSEGGTYSLTITNTENGCTETMDVVVGENISTPMAVIATPDELTCTSTEISLDGSGSSGAANLEFLWTTNDGSITGGDNMAITTANGAGTYTLLITDPATGCTDMTVVTVAADENIPVAVFIDPGMFTCSENSFILDASNSSTVSGNLDFTWTSNIADPSTLTPEITNPGVYSITITDVTNGCEAVTSIMIEENVEMPEVTATETATLICGETSVPLQASTPISNPSYQWFFNNDMLTGENNSTINATQSGTYLVEVTDGSNGCVGSATSIVTQDDNVPSVSIAPANNLTCDVTSLTLDASGSDNGVNFIYQWVASNGGNILSGETTLTPQVDAIGTYTLTITNSNNNCSSNSFINVTNDIATPTAEAGQTLQFACGDTQAILDGTGSDTGANVAYLWTTNNGVIESGETTLMPTVSSPGIYTLTVTNLDNGCTATDEVQITQDTNAPTAMAGTAASLTCNVNSVTLDGSGSSMGADFTYLWTTNNGNIVNGASTLNPEVNAVGTYILTVTNNANNCTTSSSVMVSLDNTEPNVVIATADFLTCGESSVTLNGSASDNGANFTPMWTTLGGNIVAGANTYTPTVDMAGTYILEITNNTNGCANSNSIEVQVDGDTPTVVIATPDQLTCSNTSLVLNANGSDFGNGFTISWSTDTGTFIEGQETLSPTIAGAGNYTLSITNLNNGCTDATNIVVTADTTAPMVNAGQTQTLDCTLTSIDLNGSTNLDTGTILWTTNNGNITAGATTLTPTVNAAGIYTLTITNPDNGCSESAEVMIALDPSVPEVLIATPTMLTCETTSLTLDASQTTSDQDLIFQWTTNNGNIVSGADTPMPIINQAGNYVLTILIGDNCTNTASIVVLEDTETPTADAGADFTINCTDPSSLNGTNSSIGTNITYEWTTNNGTLTDGVQTLQPSINGGGLYTLTVLNTQNGCSATDVVNVIDNAPESIQSLLLDPDCFSAVGSFGVSSVNGGTPPYSYSVDGGLNFQTSANFPDLAPGSYEFVVQDANECTYTESFEIAGNNELSLELKTFDKIDLGDSYQINAIPTISIENIESIQWSPLDSLSCNDCLNPIVTPSETTTYTVVIIDENGCEATASINIVVNREVPIYIPSAFSPDDDGLNDFFTIHATDEKIKNINILQIFNRWGELVFENFNFRPNDLDAGWDGSFDGEILNPAVFVYWTEIELQDGRLLLMKGDVSIVK